MRRSSRMQSTRRMRAWTSPDLRRRLSVAERSCTTTARLSERPAPDASFPAVNFNGPRFVPSATEPRIASCCIGLPMKQIARNVTIEGWGALRDCRYLLHDSRHQVYPVFRAIIASGRVERLALPVRGPDLNAFIRRAGWGR